MDGEGSTGNKFNRYKEFSDEIMAPMSYFECSVPTCDRFPAAADPECPDSAANASRIVGVESQSQYCAGFHPEQ